MDLTYFKDEVEKLKSLFTFAHTTLERDLILKLFDKLSTGLDYLGAVPTTVVLTRLAGNRDYASAVYDACSGETRNLAYSIYLLMDRMLYNFLSNNVISIKENVNKSKLGPDDIYIELPEFIAQDINRLVLTKNEAKLFTRLKTNWHQFLDLPSEHRIDIMKGLYVAINTIKETQDAEELLGHWATVLKAAIAKFRGLSGFGGANDSPVSAL